MGSGRHSGQEAPTALVLGLAVHGLAVARALARYGVAVDAFAQHQPWQTATTRTRYAEVYRREGLNTDDLVDHLRAFARARPGGKPIVLFPTSDRMVSAIARHWPDLDDRYRLSWAHCRELVLELQQKVNLPARALAAGIPAPRTVTVVAGADPARLLAEFGAPAIAKPSMPLASFKAAIVSQPEELAALVARHAADLPFVLQTYIEGDGPSLWAATAYLDHGRELGLLTSRKLAAFPPDTGIGTVFATAGNAEVARLARQFFAGLDLSGPVAVEFKRDREGRYWLIEPNLGRTEYCVDLAIQSGLNLPCMEFRQAAGLPPDASLARPTQDRAWFDTDRDPACHRRFQAGPLAGSVGDPIFPFAGHGDPLPWAWALAEGAVRAVRGGVGDLLRSRRRP